MTQDANAEIVAAVRRALAGMGVRGSVAVVGQSIELRVDGAPVEIDIENTVKQWMLLPPEMRARRANETAVRLVEALRAAGGPGAGDASEPSAMPNARVLAAVAGLFGLLALVGVLRYVLPRLHTEKPETGVPSESGAERTARLSRACDAMRSRLLTGGSFGPFATEGWVVEIWLAAKGNGKIRDHRALAAVIANQKLTAAADEELARVTDGSAEIVDGFSAEEAQRSPGYSAASLVLREGYARVFLEPEMRPHVVSLAERLADGTGADLAAVYGRCAHLSTHDIGAWYRGPDAAGATASMVYTMGLFADALVVDRGALAAVHADGGDLGGLVKAAGAADAEVLSRAIAAQGGAMSSGKGVAFLFPLGGPTRALAAARVAARKMRVGVGTD